MKRLWTHLPLVLAIAVMANAPSAQSLADLAKKEDARRKNIKAPAKVITNQDLPSVPPPPVAQPPAGAAATPDAAATPAASGSAGGAASPASQGTAAAPAGDTAKTEPAVPVKDEAYWKQRITT